jgi:hypothetical protein
MMKSQNAQTPKHHWTEEEDQILRLCYENNMTDSETADMLGLTQLQIRNRRLRFGLLKRDGKKISAKHKWTEEEDKILTQCIKMDVTDKEIAKRIGVTKLQVKGRREKLGLKKDPGWQHSVKWTEGMLSKMERLFKLGKNDAEIGKELGISRQMVGCKRRQLGIYHYKQNKYKIPCVKPLKPINVQQGDVVKLRYKGIPQLLADHLDIPIGIGGYMDFIRPLVFEGLVHGEGPGTDKCLFRSKAGWRVTFTLPQLQDYEVEVVS